MANISEIQEISRIRELDTNSESGGHHTSPYYLSSVKFKSQGKPSARTSRQIRDTAFVMGIPIEEITPKVHEAMTLIMHEMDSLRWEMEVAKKHSEHLEHVLDFHEVLPVVSRPAFMLYLSHAVDHVARTKEPSFVLFLKVLGIDDLWQKHGSSIRDAYLIHVANLIRRSLDQVDVVGALDHGEFGVILNLYQADAVAAKAQNLATLIDNSPFLIEETEQPIVVELGSQEILANVEPAQIMLSVAEQARQSQF